MKKITFCCMLMFIAACAVQKDPSPSNVFTGGKWVIVELMEMMVDPSKSGKEPPYMDFSLAEKRMSAFAGCNRMNAGFEISRDTITFSPMISTRMACPDMDYENAIERLLVPGNYTFKENGNNLIIFFNGSKVLSFVRP